MFGKYRKDTDFNVDCTYKRNAVKYHDRKGGLVMESKVLSAVGGAVTDGLKAVGIESIREKATEFANLNIRNPRLISSIKDQLNSKYGNCPVYNDLSAYIDKYSVIESASEEISDIKLSEGCSKESFVEKRYNDFCTIYKRYSVYDYSIVKEALAWIFEEVFRIVLCLNVHSDLGKLQAFSAMQFAQVNKGMETNTDLLYSINAKVSRISTMMNPVNDDFGQTSEKVAEFLKKIESVGDKDNPVEDSEKALLLYQELSVEALSVLRGENQVQLDKVICAINCHMAVCYGNLGNLEKAFECLGKISPKAAEESKLYQFVNAVLIVNHGLEDRFSEAEQCLNKALEIDPNHRRAYLVCMYLKALQKTASLEGILGPLDNFFEKMLLENKEKELLADYYIYRGFICKEFKEYDMAEHDFLSAKECGYDEVVVDYNLALLYYSRATQDLPKDTRIFCRDVDVAILRKAIELLRDWLIDRRGEKIPTYIMSQMVGVYVSSCVLLGNKHGLSPIEEYLKLPNLEYEVQRMLIMGADNIDKTTLSLLDEDDALYARIVNKLNENRYDDVKKSLLLMSEEEKSTLPVTTIYLILQASISNKDLDTYYDFRKYITEVDAIGLIECIDAYAKEANGEVELAKNTFDKYAASSKDYHLLRNIVGFYVRNGYDVACEQLLVRISDLLEMNIIYIDDKPEFYSLAINFLVTHKSEYAKKIVDLIDIESEQMWELKAYYYSEIKDISHLLEALTLLYQSTGDYGMGYKEVLCLMGLLKYDEALMKATELLATVHENNIKDRIQLIWMISHLYLLLGQNKESFEWARKAHELTMDMPGDASHNAYLLRATRTGYVDEALGGIIEYKERHPVVVAEWMKEVRMPEENSGEGIIQAIESAVGRTHEEYTLMEKKRGILYRKGVLPNSTILDSYGGDIVQLFIFAQKNKLRISHGSWSAIEGKKVLVGNHIVVDAVTLIVMQKYGCLDAIKRIEHVHVCHETVNFLQEQCLKMGASWYVEPILEWLRQADNIIFEPSGFQQVLPMTDILSEDILTCCRVASRLKVPFLTYEILVEDMARIEEFQMPKGVQVIGLVAFCYATMGDEPDKLNQMLYNLLEECTFINFTSETILGQIKRSDYIVSEDELSRFFICNTSCEMISFANVYIGVINALKDQHYSASLEFSRLVLENALIVWRRGAHYRSMSQYHNIEMATGKGKMISAYLYYLAEGIKSVYGAVPVEIEGLLGDVVNKSIHDISQKVISEMKDTL